MEKADSTEQKEKKPKEKWSLRETFRRMNRQQWIVLLLLGVLLAVISMPAGNSRSPSWSSLLGSRQTGSESSAFGNTASSFRSQSSSEAQTAFPGTSSSGSILSVSGQNASTSEETVGKTILEQKLESLLSGVEGIGKTQILLMTQEKTSDDFYESSSTQVTGVLISAQGADDPVIIQNIKDAMIALFQIEAHKIKVMKMK